MNIFDMVFCSIQRTPSFNLILFAFLGKRFPVLRWLITRSTAKHVPNLADSAGHPALIGRHRPFPVTRQAAERWLHHMQQALDSVTEIDDDSKTKMMNFFRWNFFWTPFSSWYQFLLVAKTKCMCNNVGRHTAFFLVAGNELKNQNQQVPCKHAASKPAAS